MVFSLRTLFDAQPTLFLLVIVLATYFPISFCIYVQERDEQPQEFNLAGSLFFTAVAATTVGFGRLVPVDPWGKALAILACCWGIIILSLTVTVVQRGLALTDAEALVWEAAKGVSERVASASPQDKNVTGVRLLTREGEDGKVVNRRGDCIMDAASLLQCCGGTDPCGAGAGGADRLFAPEPGSRGGGGSTGGSGPHAGYQELSEGDGRASLLGAGGGGGPNGGRGGYGTSGGGGPTTVPLRAMGPGGKPVFDGSSVQPSSPGGRVLPLHVSREASVAAMTRDMLDQQEQGQHDAEMGGRPTGSTRAGKAGRAGRAAGAGRILADPPLERDGQVGHSQTIGLLDVSLPPVVRALSAGGTRAYRRLPRSTAGPRYGARSRSASDASSVASNGAGDVASRPQSGPPGGAHPSPRQDLQGGAIEPSSRLGSSGQPPGNSSPLGSARRDRRPSARMDRADSRTSLATHGHFDVDGGDGAQASEDAHLMDVPMRLLLLRVVRELAGLRHEVHSLRGQVRTLEQARNEPPVHSGGHQQ